MTSWRKHILVKLTLRYKNLKKFVKMLKYLDADLMILTVLLNGESLKTDLDIARVCRSSPEKKNLFDTEGSPSLFGSLNETKDGKSIQLLLNYNLEDWSNGGWTHFLEG